jgi:ATP-binding cassette subfamily C (CFTR/MRP) protein 1
VAVMASNPICLDDGSFGPVVQACRDGFDFTVTFERTILSILPSSIFIVAAVARSAFLARWRRMRVARSGAFQFSKLVCDRHVWCSSGD